MAAQKEYHIGKALYKPAAHHESFEKLWETKWKAPCKMGVYPFMFGCIQDFEPVAQSIVMKRLKEPYDWDEYAQMFFPKAEELARVAEDAAAAGEMEKACEYYLRSSAIYRIARFPIPRSEKQRLAWAKGKEVFYKGAALLTTPIHEVVIPHTHALVPSEPANSAIPINFLLPASASPSNPAPLVLILTGLDGYRTELAIWQPGFAAKGVATAVVEIPGTGDSPAAARDPTSPDRQWSSVLDWIDAQKEIDSERVIVWGFSTGGYYALRMAHTHTERLMGAVSLGGGADRMFDDGWLRHVDKLEYPFDLRGALAEKFGYGLDVEGFMSEARRRFSLVEDGTLQRRCCKVLLVNGDGDEIFPIEDLWVALDYGMPKMARVVKGTKHMGGTREFCGSIEMDL
ncbi:hypothetical protein MMYC01_203766 [Madurella mycetomatis]|uniref:2,6-dihydropseudooxynicotine hydrolase n=1 Tax=Madurella mycetomatis TaxID=100816 RepID=A0A175W8C4_9PEZI|nr:hypothetical protein MMYC01_203766 [Madurella mycetomatis]